MLLSKFKGYFNRLKKEKELEEEVERLAGLTGEELRKELEKLKMGDPTAFIVPEGDSVVPSTEEDELPEVVPSDEESDHEEENTTEESPLDFSSAFISDDFPMTEARAMVKERDRKFLKHLLYQPETIKKHNKRGNQVLTALCAIPTATYMAVVASSAVALPPVAMGLIGFGIAGGIVSGVNKISGQDSVLGSLYRKAKVRFGHAKPKVNLKDYKEEFNAEKNARNEKLAQAISLFKTQKKVLDALDEEIENHIATLANGETSLYARKDDEISQQILDEITQITNEIAPKLAEKKETIAQLTNEKNDLNLFIEECENCRVNSALAEDDFNKNVNNRMNELFENFKDAQVKKGEYDALLESLNNEEKALVDQYNEAITKQENDIKDLTIDLEGLEDGDYKDTLIKVIEAKKHRIEMLTNEYNDSINEFNARKDKEISDFLNSLNTDIRNLFNLNDDEALQYIVEEINKAIADFDILKSLESVTLNDSIFTENKLAVDESVIKFIIVKILANEDYSAEVEALNQATENYSADLIKQIIANLDLNIEETQKQLNEIITQGELKTAEFKELVALFNVEKDTLKEKLRERRTILTQEAEKVALDLKKSTQADFDKFKKEQMSKLNEELYREDPTL